MWSVHGWCDAERREWFAAHDADVAARHARSSETANSPSRLLLETGVILLVPLLLATLIGIILGT